MVVYIKAYLQIHAFISDIIQYHGVYKSTLSLPTNNFIPWYHHRIYFSQIEIKKQFFFFY